MQKLIDYTHFRFAWQLHLMPITKKDSNSIESFD